MIPDTIIGVVLNILQGLVELIPEWSAPDELSQSWAGVLGEMVAWANGYFPMFDLAICLGILVAVKGALLAWRVVIFVYDKIPFKAT